MDSLFMALNNIVDIILAAYNSTFFSVVKFIIGIYVVVLIMDIILLLIQRGLSGDVRDTLYGMNVPLELIVKSKQKKLKKRWEEEIRSKLESGNEASYKIAIISADGIIDDLIKRMGYKDGSNLADRLDKITPGQIEVAPQLKEAHGVMNKIVQDESFSVDLELAKKTIGLYEEFLSYHGVL